MRRSHAIVLLLAVATLLTFGRTLGNQFVTFDDEPLIYANPHLHPPSLSNLGWFWTHADMYLFIPVVSTAWWLIAQINGPGDAAMYHAANLLLHFLNAWLCFAILRRLIGADWPAAAGAILFVVHPLQTEPVAWATGLKDLLSGFLALAAIYSYIEFVLRGKWSLYVLALAIYLMALLAKPSTVTVPLICMTIEMLLLNGTWRRSAGRLLPWLIPAVLIVFVTATVQPPAHGIGGPIWARPLVATDALAFYLFKLIWPVQLGMDYGRTPAAISQAMFWTWLAPIAAAILLLRFRKNKPFIAAGAIFVLALLPVLGLHPFAFQAHSTVADRYMYLAMLGPALALAAALIHCPIRVAFGMGTILVLLSVRSIIQSGVWHDSQTLYEHAIFVNPSSLEAHNNLGVVLADEGDVAGAISEYRATIQLDPTYLPAYRYIADAETTMGQFSDAANDSRSAILNASTGKTIEELHRWRADILLQWAQNGGGRAAYSQAMDEAGDALKLDPNDSQAKKILAAARAHR